MKIEKVLSPKYVKKVNTPMSEEMFIGLEKLAENMGVNKTDVMRKGLELMIQDNPISGVCECCGSEAVLHAVNYTNYDELCDECDTGASCIQCGEMIDPEDGQEMCFECYSDSMPD